MNGVGGNRQINITDKRVPHIIADQLANYDDVAF